VIVDSSALLAILRLPARLNFGDCFAYALAKSMREPLLFKGADFGLTDVIPAA
jgi:ribonuclease VapC